MNRHGNRTSTRLGAGLASLAVAGMFLPTGSAAAAAADGDVDVLNTETVQVYTDASGKIETQRIYEQLTLVGQGSVDFDNPVEEQGLRNLDGFAGLDVSDGAQRVRADVDGAEHLRSVSHYDGDLPLDLSIEYRLDGEEVEPEDVVGQDGDLEVTYTVKNVSGEQQEISYPDGSGGTVTETVEVPLPMVGSLSTVLPANFTEVESGQANMAGDGRGGTKLSFTMTLLPPIGSDTATFGYTARIEDGVIPRATISALPVNPLESPTFNSAATSYQGGAQTGADLTAGATEIDANLLKIRDGAAELLAGLIKLHDGSEELSTGLQDEAAPGARKLADGAGDLRDGLGKIDDGAGKLAGGTRRLDDGLGRIDDGAGRLADGAGRLSDGTSDALSGSRLLEDGLGQISGGLSRLASVEGLPKAAAGVDALLVGVNQILAGLGAAGQTGTLLDGLTRIEAGAGQLHAGATQIKGGIDQLDAGLPVAKGGVDQVKAGLDAAVAPQGNLDQLIAGLTGLKAICGAPCAGLADTLIAGATQSKQDLTAASVGLGQVSGGLSMAIAGLGQLVPGANALVDGLATLEAGATQANVGATALRDGVVQVKGGLVQLDTGLTSAVAGILKLSTGASAAHAGSGDLTTGLGLIDGGAGELTEGAGRLADGAGDARDGADRLADGAGKLAAGTGEAYAGSGLLSDGARELAAGLGVAADGSGRLADGLELAREGAPALPRGADRLSKEGMSQLVAAGQSTAKQYGKLYATVEAGSKRAESGTMAFGAPEGARALMAYSFEIQGEDGEGSRNLARGMSALVLGGLGLGAFALRRRLI